MSNETPMDASYRKEWIRAAFLVGAVYFLIGIVFANLVHGWRPAAWLVSGIAYLAHIWFEHFRLRNPPRLAALHVAAAVAIGAFGLAVAGMIRSLSTAPTIRPAWLLAIVAWPAATAVPAFVVALVVGAILSRRPRSADAG
jgi:hypothetical protein